MTEKPVDNLTPAAPQELALRDLGRMRYGPAFELQKELNQAVVDGEAPPTLLLVEHEPVITVSQRRSAGQHIVASKDRLARMGIEVHETDRGGDITYHGPGQLVAYPIVQMSPLGFNLGRYMRALEQVVIDTLARFGVEGQRDPGATGVWVEQKSAPGGTELAKVCAMGVRVRKNTTMHGLALNVTTDLAHFATIIPCGLAGRPVTSLEKLLNASCPGMDEVKAELVRAMNEHLTPSAEPAE